MKHTLASLLIVGMLASCTAGDVASALLGGGGPNVAANTQAGKTNTQGVGQTTVVDQKIVRPQARDIEQSTGETSVRAERVETVTINEINWWTQALLLLLAGFVIPSPLEIARWVRSKFSGTRK